MSNPISPSFKTNVNRTKTKRWVEAKSYSYEGDDWGDSDDDDYDRGTPASQAGASRPAAGFEGPYPQPADRGRYGELAFQPNPQSMRGASTPLQGPPQGRPSFDRGDDRRTYSLNSQSGMGDGPYPSSGRPPPFAPGEQYGPPRRGSPRTQSPLRVNTGQRKPSMDFDPYPHAPFIADSASARSPHNFRPESRGGAYPDVRGGPYPEPRGGPFPEPRGRPYPQPRPGPYGNVPYAAGPYAGPPPSAGRRSQSSNRPPMSDIMGRTGSPSRGFYGPGPGPPPMQAQGRGSSSGSRESSPSKRPPPRKSSLSQEQTPYNPPGAPSEPASGPPGSNETSTPPQKALPFIRPADIYKRMEEEREKQRRQSEESSRPSLDNLGPGPSDSTSSLRQRGSTESLGRGTGLRPSAEGPNDADSGSRLKPVLDPVIERKSEYGFENVLKDAPKEHPSVQPARRSPTTRDQEPPSASSTYSNRPDPVSASTARSTSGRSLGSMALPEVEHMASFGDDIWQGPDRQTSIHGAAQQTRSSDDRGFNAAVNQAFDASQSLVPPTPSSSVGDSIIRSNSANTSDVSPIISRSPSNAATESRQPATQTQPTILEEPFMPTPRPDSISTVKAPRTSQSDEDDEDFPNPPRSGFRRNTESPSPSNSPARRPLSIVTSENPVSGFGTVPAEALSGSAQNISPACSSQELAKQSDIHPNNTESEGSNHLSDGANHPIPRAESPTKGTVRGLTDKFETTSTRSSPAASPERREMSSVKPPNTRLESFRPSLPGGWNSYTTNTEGSTPDVLPREPTLAELRQQEAGEAENDGVVAHAPRRRVEDEETPQSRAFAAAAAAGSALAGAFATTTHGSKELELAQNTTSRGEGMGVDSSSETTRSGHDARYEQEDQRSYTPARDSHIAAGVLSSAASSVPPTPPPKDTPSEMPQQPSNDLSYFPSPLRTGRSRSPETLAATPLRPNMIPTLSTDTSPQDTESDRLRKEIVKSLTPRASDIDKEGSFTSREPAPKSPSNLGALQDFKPPLESPLLPKEYDSYWNEAKDEVHEDAAPTNTSREILAESVGDDQPTQGLSDPQHEIQDLSEERPQAKRRFSWESWSEEEEPVQQPLEPRTALSPDTHPVPDESNEVRRQFQEVTVSSSGEEPLPAAQIPDQSVQTWDKPESIAELPAEFTGALPPVVDQSLKTGVREVAQAQENRSDESLPTKEEPHIMAFREIVAITSTSDRIHAYNHAREQFASIETGLGEWMKATGDSIPEHADMVANNGRFSSQDTEAILGHKVSPSRSKFPRIVSLNAASQSNSNEDKPPADLMPGAKVTEQLLASAGKFGGKAGGAAKGLFAKGKNKFRSSGAGEKVDT